MPPGVGLQTWEKACRNMVLSTVRNCAGQSVQRVEKGALRMNLWVRQLRGLCLVGLVLAGMVFCAAVGAVATATPCGSAIRKRDRRRRQPPGRGGDHPLLFPSQPGRAPRQLQDRPGAQGALRHRPVPGRADQPVRRPADRDRGGKSGAQPGRLRRQQEDQGRSTQERSAVEDRAARCRVRPCRPTCSASSISTGATAASTSGSIPKIIDLPNNRVDLVFEIKEGDKTGVKKIVFVGNKAYGDQRLKDEIKTAETSWFPVLAFFQQADIYDPDRIEADRDLLRRFYLKHGYADVRVVSAVSVYDPDKKGFIVTFTLDEGARYKFGKIDIQSTVPAVEGKALYGYVKTGAGAVYNAEAVEKSVENLVDRGGPPRLSVRRRSPARRPRCSDPHHQCGFHRRGRSARLHRADQHSRQRPHPRLRDPARIRYRRRRRLQPRAGRPRGTAPEEPQLFQDRSRSPTSRARRPTASCSMSTLRKSRPANSRSPAAIRPRAAGWPNSASPNATCWARASTPGSACSTASTPEASNCRSQSPISWATASASVSISIPSRPWRRTTSRTTARPSARRCEARSR